MPKQHSTPAPIQNTGALTLPAHLHQYQHLSSREQLLQGLLIAVNSGVNHG